MRNFMLDRIWLGFYKFELIWELFSLSLNFSSLRDQNSIWWQLVQLSNAPLNRESENQFQSTTKSIYNVNPSQPWKYQLYKINFNLNFKNLKFKKKLLTNVDSTASFWHTFNECITNRALINEPPIWGALSKPKYECIN